MDFIDSCDEPILLTAESASRREILLELLKGKVGTRLVKDFDEFLTNPPISKVGITIATIDEGLHIKQAFCVISEAQILVGKCYTLAVKNTWAKSSGFGKISQRVK